jgi:hypothetical protein
MNITDNELYTIFFLALVAAVIAAQLSSCIYKITRPSSLLANQMLR